MGGDAIAAIFIAQDPRSASNNTKGERETKRMDLSIVLIRILTNGSARGGSPLGSRAPYSTTTAVNNSQEPPSSTRVVDSSLHQRFTFCDIV